MQDRHAEVGDDGSYKRSMDLGIVVDGGQFDSFLSSHRPVQKPKIARCGLERMN